MKYLYGIQPTGRIHIGNYLGGLRFAIKKDADVMIAHYHAITSGGSNDLKGFADSLIKLGAHVIFQDYRALESAWMIQCITPFSEMKRMTQFKDKGECNVGLFTYPCLMAADIILADPDFVIVGEDQLQHMEFYRKSCRRLGIKHIAENFITETPRIMSIKDPSKKMSKSLGDEHCLYLGDDIENANKIMKSPTTPEGIANLKQIAKGFGIEFDEKNCKQSKENLIEKIKSS